MNWICKIFGHRYHLVTDGRALELILTARYRPIVKLEHLAFLCDRCFVVRTLRDVKGWKE